MTNEQYFDEVLGMDPEVEAKFFNAPSERELSEEAVIRVMTLDEIASLPNMLGKIASVQCREHGEYKCVIDGVKTHIVRKG